MADWGYNRDRKKGKKQLVGLLCDKDGDPASIEIFRGNTREFNTLESQIEKSVEHFGCRRVIWIGDRGMIKSVQKEQLKKENFYYISAITKPQIKVLIKKDNIQLEMFDETIAEADIDGVRHLLRRNPTRAAEIRLNRESRRDVIEKMISEQNRYLPEHKKAKPEVAVRRVENKISILKLSGWLKAGVEDRTLYLTEDKEILEEKSLLDGCYALVSDLPFEVDKEVIHQRYKDLYKVERAFRTSKTELLELRPWYVATEESSRGHALVVMLSYLIVKYLREAWKGFDITVEEAIQRLSLICSVEVKVKGKGSCHKISEPDDQVRKLLEAVDVRLPSVLPELGAKVVSGKKLNKVS